MKTLKFENKLAELILGGKKDMTWRFFDDKDLQNGDELILINRGTGDEFARAKIIKIREKEFKNVDEADFGGHEKYNDNDEMFKTYKGYYGDKLTWETPVKIIKFVLI